MDLQEYIRTDLAAEAQVVQDKTATEGVYCREEEKDGIRITTVRITDARGEAAIGKPKGTYVTLFFDRPWEEEGDRSVLIRHIGEEVTALLERTRKKVTRILIVGLGNRGIAADAIGPTVADNVAVDLAAFAGDVCPPELSFLPTLCAVSPGVMGQTGIETAELVRGAVLAAGASHVIAVDSLAARSSDRLCRTVQLSDTGITPGSGVGNHRAALNEETLGVPVIAVGVPAMVDSSTLVYDALEKAGIHEPAQPLVDLLENNRSFFVTLKDCDVASACLGHLIAEALNRLPELLMTAPALSYT